MPNKLSLSRFFSCIRATEEQVDQYRAGSSSGLCTPEKVLVSINGVTMQHLVAYPRPCAIVSGEDELEKKTEFPIQQDMTLVQTSIADSLSDIRLPEMDSSPSVSIIMDSNDEFEAYKEAGLVF